MTTYLNIFIAPIEAPLSGQWHDLLTAEGRETAEKAAEAIHDALKESFIADYEAEFSIGQYDSIESLIETGEKLEELDEVEQAVAVDLMNDYDDIYEVIRELEKRIIFTVNTSQWSGSTSAAEALGYFLIDEVDGKQVPEWLEGYIDYEAYGRDALYEYEVIETDDGYTFYTSY